VTIFPDGRLLLGAYLLKPEEIAPAFEFEFKRSPRALVVIQADQSVPHGRVVQVMQQIRGAGFSRLAVGVNEGQ
jgi:biopolymer transport protein ExbD